MSTIQVDRIIPYQSSSVSVEGLSAPNLATTGSNTFVGNQNIQGTITASIQEGFVLAGGVGNVSTLVATSSFGGGGSGFPFTGNAVITGSLVVSGSTSIIPVNAPNTPPGGVVQYIIPFLSGSNFTFARDIDNALSWVPLFNQLSVSSSTANTNVTPGGIGLNSSTTGSVSLSTTRITSNFGAGRIIAIAADAAGTLLPGLTGITNPAIILQSGSATTAYYTPIQFQASQSFTDGRVTVTTPLIGLQGVEITGSVKSTSDITTNTQIFVTGSNFRTNIQTGATFISSSAGTPTFGERQINITVTGVQVRNVGSGSGTLLPGDATLTKAGTTPQIVEIFNDEGTVAFQTDANGGYISDYDPVAGDYSKAIKLQPFSSYGAGQVTVLRRLDVSGSINPSPNNQVKFQTGSNQQVGTAVLDGGNPGSVTVSNSLVTSNSIILVSKQTLTNPNGYVAVSSKGTGTFTITSNHNGDNDTVGYMIINNV